MKKRNEISKKNYNAKSFSTKFLPIIPLVCIKLPVDDKDKSAFITFELKVKAGTGTGTPSCKKNMRTFKEGYPQEWMNVLTGLKKSGNKTLWWNQTIKQPRSWLFSKEKA
jgi:hypothetical protein